MSLDRSFSKETPEQPFSDNGKRCPVVTSDFSVSFPIDNGKNDRWFQQDGATARTARATIALLRSLFFGL